MIRHQQAQLQAIQQQASYTPLSSSTALDDTTPPSERSTNYPYPSATPPNPASASSMLASNNPRPSSPFRGSVDVSRQSSRRSRTPSRTASPSLRPVSAGLQGPGEEWCFTGRSQTSFDDSAFYQAETQMLTRENQMLKQRIRELGMSTKRGHHLSWYLRRTERQLGESSSAAANTPTTPSNLTAPPLEPDNTEAIPESHASATRIKED